MSKRLALVGATGVALGATLAFLKRRGRQPARIRKGMFIEHSLSEAPSFQLREIGVEWVLVQTGIQKKSQDAGDTDWITRDRAKMEALERELNPPGVPYKIQVWGWGWPIPSRVGPFSQHVIEVLSSPVVEGYCLDIEAKDWSTKENGEAVMHMSAASLINTIRLGSPKKLLLSSHGRADYAPLPWRALSVLDGALPQTYDASNKYGDGFIARCIKTYQDKGFSFVAPTLGASTFTPERMFEQLKDVPPAIPAISWWTWTSIGRNAERRRVISAFGASQEQIA